METFRRLCDIAYEFAITDENLGNLVQERDELLNRYMLFRNRTFPRRAANRKSDIYLLYDELLDVYGKLILYLSVLLSGKYGSPNFDTDSLSTIKQRIQEIISNNIDPDEMSFAQEYLDYLGTLVQLAEAGREYQESW